MYCEKCEVNLEFKIEGSVQGWRCPICGVWGVLTTYIDPIYDDMTEYSVFINDAKTNSNNIKLIAKIAGVNFITAKQMLMEGNVQILKAKAPEIKSALEKLDELKIPYEVIPEFKY